MGWGSVVRKVGGERKIVSFFSFFFFFEFPCWEVEPSGGGSSLPGLRGEVIDLSQVLHGRAFQGVRQLDPHSELLLKVCKEDRVYRMAALQPCTAVHVKMTCSVRGTNLPSVGSAL